MILRVIHGTYTADHIEVEWGDEVHDQEIATVAHDRFLFLKKTESGTYKGTHYGRSYWPTTGRVTDARRADLDGKNRKFRHEYPVTMVKFTPAEKRRLITRDGKIEYVQVKQLVEYIRERKSRRPRR